MTRTVVITGVAGGIGSAIAVALAGSGWAIVGIDGNRQALDTLQAAHPEFTLIQGDGGNETDLATVAERASEIGQLAAWVNCAGVLTSGALDSLSAVDITEQLTANLTVTVLGCRQALRSFLHTSTAGAIVNIGSIHATQPFAGHPLYAASKGAIESLTRQLCVEYGARGMRFVVVAPGAVRTRMTGDPDEAAALSPMGRVSEPDEIAGTVDFLLSPAARGINGEVVHVDNGMIATGRNR